MDSLALFWKQFLLVITYGFNILLLTISFLDLLLLWFIMEITFLFLLFLKETNP